MHPGVLIPCGQKHINIEEGAVACDGRTIPGPFLLYFCPVVRLICVRAVMDSIHDDLPPILSSITSHSTN